MRPRALVFAVAFFACIGAAEAAPSKADQEKARQSFTVGKAAYARGDFAGAAAAFEQAAFYAPHPSPLLNAAESWELAEKPARAAQLCDRVLEMPNIDAQFLKGAQQELAKVEKKVGTILVKAPARARIEVDEHEETTAKIRVMPGAHKVKVTDADGEARTQSVTVAGGESKDLDFLTPGPPKTEDTKPSPLVEQKKDEESKRRGGGPPLATWICFGAGAVATGVGVYFGIQTLGAKDDFDAHPTTTARDQFKSDRFATDVAIGVAAASLAVGFILWAVASPNDKNSVWNGSILTKTW